MLTRIENLMANLNERQRRLLAGRSPSDLAPEEQLELHNLQGVPLPCFQAGDFRLDPTKIANLSCEDRFEAANAETLINKGRRRLRALERGLRDASGAEKIAIEREVAAQRRAVGEVWAVWKDKGGDVPFSE